MPAQGPTAAGRGQAGQGPPIGRKGKEMANRNPQLQFPQDPAELWPLAILTSIRDSVHVIDRSYRIIWSNGIWNGRRVIDPDQLRGQLCHRAFRDRKNPCTDNCPVTKAFETGRTGLVERSFLGSDGREYWGESRAYPVFDHHGHIPFAIKIGFDITGRKADMKKRQRYLDTLERALEDMSGVDSPANPPQEAATQRFRLTNRELEVLRLMAQGLSNPGISKVLSISPHTTKSHVVHIYNKLGVNDRAQAAVWAARLNLV